MLTTLRIKNLALVEDLTLELESGYNAITGETGAGKSIIIGALSLVLGERADRTLIRSGSESCSVEAVFELPALRARLKSFLEGNGLEDGEGHQLVLKRTFSTNGTNRQFVNGSPTTLAVLASLGEWLVDIHGPHDHQSLLRPAVQLAILDAFGGVQEQREAFGGLVRRRAVLEAEKSQLAGDDASLAREIELLRFQAREIGEAQLKTGEEDLLRQEFERSSNAAKLLDLCQAAQGLMSEGESSLLNLAGSLGRTLQALNKIDAGAAGLLEQQEQFTGCLRELQNEVSRYADKIEVNSERLKELEDRLDLVHSLKRKYGATIEEVLAHEQKAEQKLQQLEQRDAELSRISSEIATADAELRKTGQALSRRREKIIPLLCKSATKELKALGFASSHFEVSLHTDGEPGRLPQASGFDSIEFLFAPNVGEPPRPLRAIASSGEMARVMLALKTVLARVDEIPVLVFDEVEANVGGETAAAVGQRMREISRQRQVLCITHLAPVAASAATHYRVTKQVKGGRTVSEIRQLAESDRVTELARMLGGQSEAARRHAEELLKV